MYFYIHMYICIYTQHFLLELEAGLLQSILLLLPSRGKQHGAKWIGRGKCLCLKCWVAFIHFCLSGSKCNINH